MKVNERLLREWTDRFKASWEEEAGDYDHRSHAADHRHRVDRAQRVLTYEQVPDLTVEELQEILLDTDAGSSRFMKRRVEEALTEDGATHLRSVLADLVAAAQKGLTPGDFRRATDATPGLGSMTFSELLAYRFPDRYWTYGSNVTLPAFQALGLDVGAALSRGQKGDEHIYLALREPMEQVVAALREAGFAEADYLFADMFLWFVKEESRSTSSEEQIVPLQSRLRRIWKISAGSGGTAWPQFRDHSIIGTGFSGVKVDSHKYASLEEMWAAAQRVRGEKHTYNKVRQVWTFAREMDIGDIVVAYGSKTVLAIGEITGEYVHDPSKPFPFTRQWTVHWTELTSRSVSSFSPELRSRLGLRPTIVDLTEEHLAEIRDRLKVALIGAAAEKKKEDDLWLEPAQELLARTGKVTSWWSYIPDPEYVDRLRESLPTWLYISYSGHITWRGRIADFVGPENKPIASPWPEHTLPEERGPVKFIIPATGKEHDARMWFLLDHIESVDPPLRSDDFEPIGDKYQKPGQKNFAFVYEPATESPPPPPSTPISSLSAHLSANGFHFPYHLLATYYLSLQTKPFVILSGLSGTGKTKLAQLFAEFISPPEHAALIPVHPDWTDHRGLLGFHHLLTGTYHATGFLRLLLQAYASEERRPYFAILDEMNLARVEHYFADFLSIMESRRLGADGEIRQDPFSLHDQPRCVLAAGNEALAEGYYTADADHKTCTVACGADEGCPFRTLVDEQHHQGEYSYDVAHRGGFDPLHFVPPCLQVPLNVYFTGTVNVDETTFTFSPKVLDRANVIEFGEVDLEGYWQGAGSKRQEAGEPGNPPCADEAAIRAFTHNFTYPFATGLREEARRVPDLAPYRQQLVVLVRLLKPCHLHFGYRVADEILVYLLNACRLNDADFDMNAAFDHAILQKILPRFHGSRARLWRPLLRLLAFCTDNPATAEEKAKAWEDRDVTWIEEQIGKEPRLHHSINKLQRMLYDLETEGFTSFT